LLSAVEEVVELVGDVFVVESNSVES